MKIRNGLVSNSSSSCFILDLRNPRVQKLVNECVAPLPESLNRRTAMAVGKAAVNYAKQVVSWYESDEWTKDCYSIGHMILKHAQEIGEDNITFMRESDEGMGGYLFPSKDSYENQILVRDLALEEMEYH